MTMTTIKVPRELRDRLAERAAAEGTTLAGAIRHALDASDQEVFWQRVRRDHARLTDADRRAVVPDPTLADGLADPGDDALAPEDW